MLRALLAEHGGGRVPKERGPVRGLARLLRRNPTDAERALWQALVNDRRFAGRGFKRQTPVGQHICDFVSFPLRLVDRPGAGGRKRCGCGGARAEKRGGSTRTIIRSFRYLPAMSSSIWRRRSIGSRRSSVAPRLVNVE